VGNPSSMWAKDMILERKAGCTTFEAMKRVSVFVSKLNASYF